ncbi:flagellar assembly protein FliW [Arthrobacter sp. H41]|uniref:flagellar assembly protein FliW n=1 Tax=Arthrobacter sp. H41 TaxID=1312978 RepID=UPI00047CD659|nr:flagellar assembly protein FliW [Arthrobacter sp. H41]
MRLRFLTPPPGLSPLVDFILDTLDGADGLYALRSDGTGEIAGNTTEVRMFVLDSALYLPDYEPPVSAEQHAALGLGDDEPLILVVANPGASGTTVNLMAPIVLNRTTGACAQVILDGAAWPLRAELTRAA